MRSRFIAALPLAAVLALSAALACGGEPEPLGCADAARQAGVDESHIRLLEKDETTAQERIIIDVVTNAYDLQEACAEEPAERTGSEAITNEEIVATIRAALSTVEARATPTPEPTPETTPAPTAALVALGAPTPTAPPELPTPTPAMLTAPTAMPAPEPTAAPTREPTPTATPRPAPFPTMSMASGTNASMTPASMTPASGTNASMTPASMTPASINAGAPENYAQCADRVRDFLGSRYPAPRVVTAVIWRCMDHPVHAGRLDTDRCVDWVATQTGGRYPDWSPELSTWYAVMVCHDPSANYEVPVGITPYGACMDRAYGELRGRFQYREIALHGVAALCVHRLPTPEPHWYDICLEAEQKQARSVYPRWPTLLRDWHAAVVCVPEWDPAATPPNGDAYGACLSDVYQQTAETLPDDGATDVAVWRCLDRRPEHSGRREPGCLDRHEHAGRELPADLDTWYKMGHCLWPW